MTTLPDRPPLAAPKRSMWFYIREGWLNGRSRHGWWHCGRKRHQAAYDAARFIGSRFHRTEGDL